jgi:transcriptional regulator with XRE-family HTH domain
MQGEIVMARAMVTSELADTLRSIRLQNKIPAKTLASHLEKSAAYISKLESGTIQTIDAQELHTILHFITCSEDDLAVAEKTYATLKYKYTKEEIDDQLWFSNFDTVGRIIPIPEDLISELNTQMKTLGIDRELLIKRINANEALMAEDINDNSIPHNQWFQPRRTEDGAQSIKMQMSNTQLDDILDRNTDVSPYIFVYAIVFYILKTERFGNQREISDDDNTELMKKAAEKLNEYKFYSIAEKDALLSERQTQNEAFELLTSFDRDNIDIVTDIVTGFKAAADYNIKDTNTRLKKFSENMRWDLGFILKIVSLDFNGLEKTSVSNKRKLITEIEKLIADYMQMPEDMNKIETY